MNAKTEMIIMATAIAFALIALAEFWSKIGESRKTGYCAAVVAFALIVVCVLIENIGSIIYGTK
jgi:hypothetical protein